MMKIYFDYRKKATKTLKASVSSMRRSQKLRMFTAVQIVSLKRWIRLSFRSVAPFVRRLVSA